MVQNSRVRVYYRYALLLLGLEDSHGEFLRLLFLQAHRETAAHFTAIGMPAQQHCDSFRFRRAAFYLDLGLRSGFEPPDLDRPGRQLHQHWQPEGLSRMFNDD